MGTRHVIAIYFAFGLIFTLLTTRALLGEDAPTTTISQEKINQAMEKLAHKAPATAPATKPAAPAEKILPRPIIFVIDVTGSMLNKLLWAKNEVAQAIANMPPEQQFNVIAVGDNTVHCWKKEPTNASPANKQLAIDFVGKLACVGQGDPVEAIVAATRQHAGLIWLISDGDYSDAKAGMAKIHTATKGARTQINSLISDQQFEQEYTNVLVWIAEDTGGIAIDQKGNRVKANQPPPDAAPSGHPAPPALPPLPTTRRSIFDVP